MSNHRTGLKRIWAALCAFAMCATVCVATGHAAFAKTATDDSNVVASLKYMSELNRLRQTNRARLTAQQIADNILNQAIRLDNNRPNDDMCVVALRSTPAESDQIRRMSVRLPVESTFFK